MSRHTTSKVWRYFEYINLDSAKCIKCEKIYSRKGRTTTSLKNHLRSAHPAEYLEFVATDLVRLEKRQRSNAAIINKQKILTCSNEIGSLPSKPCNDLSFKNQIEANHTNNFCDLNMRTLESNDSICRDTFSIPPTSPPIDIKQEIVDHNSEPQTASRVTTYNDRNVMNSLQMNRTQNIEDESPYFSVSNVTSHDEFSEDLANGDNKQIVDDLLDDLTCCDKDDNFEQWIKRRTQLLEVEFLEMRNYKIKLELWEKEQQLQLDSSKFTKDIRNMRFFKKA